MKRKQTLSKTLLGIGLVLIMACTVTWFIFYAIPSLPKIIPRTPITITPSNPLTPTITPSPTPEPDNSTNILLLGYGGGKHEGTYLTDSMLILRVDPDRKKTFLISLPRDLWVKLPVSPEGNGSKINAAFAYGLDDEQFPQKSSEYKGDLGALKMTKDVVASTLGINIQNAVAVDFSAFTSSIDLLGGVDVDVPHAFTDKEYPIEGKEKDLCGKSETEATELLKDATSAAILFPCRYETISFNTGTTHLDGTTALKYVRSRHSETNGGDFARGQRQRSLIIAVKNKVLSMDVLSKIPELYKTISRSIITDLSGTDIAGSLTKLKEWSTYPMLNLGLSDENVLDPYTTTDKQYALIGLDGEYQTKIISSYMRDELKPELPKIAPIILLKGSRTEYSRLGDTKKRLVEAGLPTLDIEYPKTKGATESSIAIYGKMAPSVIEYFMRSFPGVPFTTTEKQYLNYDIVFTLAPLPTPTPSLKPTRSVKN